MISPLPLGIVNKMPGSHIAVCITLAVAVGCPCVLYGAERDVGVVEFVRVIERQRAVIEAMLVTYECRMTFDQVLKDKGLMAGHVIHQKETVAFKGDKRHSSVLATGFDDAMKDMQTERTTVFTGTDNRRRESKSLNIQKDKSGYAELNLYANMLLWPVTDAEITSCDDPVYKRHFLPYMLSVSKWQARQDSSFGSVPATLFTNEDGTQSIWTDPSRGYALLRYIQKDPIPTEAEWRFDYDDIRHVAEDIYLPYRIVSTHLVKDRDGGAVIGHTENTLEVSELAVNDVKDDLFVLDPNPGELVVDGIHRTIYRHNPPRDEALEQATKQAKLEFMRDRAPSHFIKLFAGINVMAVTVLLFLVLAFARKRSATKAK